MIASECESLARTGGLGDVVEQLSRALSRLGHHVLVVTPRYGVTRAPEPLSRWADPVPVRVGWAPGDVREVTVFELPRETDPATGGTYRVALVDDPALFGLRAGIYGDARGTFGDNELRFATLSRAGLEIGARAWLAEGGHEPDVVHAHDWHAAFAVLYGKRTMGDAWRARPFVFSIHNLAYQGVMGPEAVDRLALPREIYTPFCLEHHGTVNLMKAAVALSDAVTTVSRTYAREILGEAGGFGLHQHLRAHAHKLTGIENGIELDRFDPRTDPAIACTYDARTAQAGKARCQGALLAELGLAHDTGPVISLVSRLVWQKGVDLALESAGWLVERGARLVIVGQGEPALERAIVALAARHPKRIAARVAFDGALARRVYAASDFMLVPSRFEPCGLVQLYAMRYGAIPIVTPVGGLHDTVAPIDAARATGTGVVADGVSAAAVRGALAAALDLWASPGALAAARARGMAADVGWAAPAARYVEIYRAAAKSTRL